MKISAHKIFKICNLISEEFYSRENAFIISEIYLDNYELIEYPEHLNKVKLAEVKRDIKLQQMVLSSKRQESETGKWMLSRLSPENWNRTSIQDQNIKKENKSIKRIRHLKGKRRSLVFDSPKPKRKKKIRRLKRD